MSARRSPGQEQIADPGEGLPRSPGASRLQPTRKRRENGLIFLHEPHFAGHRSGALWYCFGATAWQGRSQAVRPRVLARDCRSALIASATHSTSSPTVPSSPCLQQRLPAPSSAASSAFLRWLGSRGETTAGAVQPASTAPRLQHSRPLGPEPEMNIFAAVAASWAA